ncbi:MAG: DNA polymerase III subunit beta [Gammaproteobacteria bacterium]|jgi:DNA polymerase-3 subunit beta|nr:DNA polymerase III subunit beta [Gammaproteobacteria bacterium]MBT3722383.1 DNA polymerase III subunit beta [Gammaproteobacteria bacterium]MBT4075307.1 DNA polymerase III subunit beta [Gammaproteobacteria bacterium]MBT4193231.1 DNA polymerase III subunit beta [Gammaproteobacteria bacterium]MBT4861249.1 DNA polymerase III subunit beta [Gammaproteobacteria bacterium]
MNIIINRDQILTPLQHVIGAVERKQTLPILGNVLIQTDNGKLTLTATDLEIELIAMLDISVTEDFSTTVPARKLLDICKALPDKSEIKFNFEDNKVILVSGRSRFTLATLPAKDFPRVDEMKSLSQFTISQKTLKLLIDKTAFAMAQQDVRYYLNGMLLELSKDGIRLVATDGHRLALSEYNEPTGLSTEKQLIIPRKGILELARLLIPSEEEVTITLSQNHIRAKTSDLIFTSKLIDGKYPDYNRVIPVDGNKKMTVNRELLKQSLHRISILSNEKYRGIRLIFSENNLSIQANNPDQEEAEEEITVQYNETNIEIGFNVTYLLDVFSVLDSEDIAINLKDANSSCIITSTETDQFRYVVMPMRL